MSRSRLSQALERVRVRMKGQPAEVPARVSGRDVREVLAVPEDRILVLRPSSGGMVQQIRDDQSIQVQDGDEFDDVPVGRWGDGCDE